MENFPLVENFIDPQNIKTTGVIRLKEVEDYIKSHKIKKITKLFIGTLIYISMIITTISLLYMVSS